MRRLLTLLGGLLVPFVFLGCDWFTPAVLQSVSTETHYKKDMIIQVNGQTFEGMAVVPFAPRYDFVIDAKGKVDLLSVHNCHRDYTKESAFEKGLFKDKSRAKFSIILFDEEESQYSCALNLGAFEKDKGRHSWGMVEVQNPSMKLTSIVKCNGGKYQYTGVGVCQGRVGSFQFMTFDEPVLSATSDCGAWQSTDNQSFNIQIPKGLCTFRFKQMFHPGEEFRITTFGYEQLIVRDL